MSATAIEDRTLIRMAVFEGILDASHLNEEDLFDIEDTVFELIASKKTPFNTWETIQ